MIKLCVGAETIEDLIHWQERVMLMRAADGLEPHPVHETRMTPKRAEELEDGGSLYWVIKHKIRVRQRILQVERVEEEGARPYCVIHLDPELVKTHIKPKRPFQGWRYLQPKDAPPDLEARHGPLKGGSEALETALKEAGVW
ncbi:MAG: DUF1489 domain-containing protein [Pseudomonadota bacterium]